MSRKGMVSNLLLVGLLAFLVIPAFADDTTSSAQIGVIGDEEKEDCTCYWDADCPGDDGDCTGYFKCKQSGKLDGTCKKKADAVPTELATAGKASTVDREALAEALTLYFDAYMVPVNEGTGRGDMGFLYAAQRVDLGSPRGFEVHGLLLDVVHEALDTTLGFDFVFPYNSGDCRGTSIEVMRLNALSPEPGNIRIVPDHAVHMLMATRNSLLEAVRTGDAEAAAGPMQAFWDGHGHYHPHHTGRYYPHGHDGEETDPAPQQIAALQRIASRLLDL